VEIKLLGISGLAVSQSCELFGISKDEFDLEARPIRLVELNRVKLKVS